MFVDICAFLFCYGGCLGCRWDFQKCYFAQGAKGRPPADSKLKLKLVEVWPKWGGCSLTANLYSWFGWTKYFLSEVHVFIIEVWRLLLQQKRPPGDTDLQSVCLFLHAGLHLFTRKPVIRFVYSTANTSNTYRARLVVRVTSIRMRTWISK